MTNHQKTEGTETTEGKSGRLACGRDGIEAQIGGSHPGTFGDRKSWGDPTSSSRTTKRFRALVELVNPYADAL